MRRTFYWNGPLSLFPLSISNSPSGILFGCLPAALFILFPLSLSDNHFPEEQSEEVAYAAGEDGVRDGQRGPVKSVHFCLHLLLGG